ncbi:hypothetical protein ACE1B4_07065, partial [Aeromonas veronii]
VNVADGTHVNVRFITLKFFFRHDRPSKLTLSTRWQANHRTVYMMDLNLVGKREVLMAGSLAELTLGCGSANA